LIRINAPEGICREKAATPFLSDIPFMTLPGADEGAVRGLEFIAEPTSERIRALAAYWQSKRAGRAMPRRADIDPTEIPANLPNIFLLDVLPDGDYRYRLMGTALVNGTGRDLTGRLLSEVHGPRPEAYGQLKALFDQVVRDKRPVYSRGSVFWLADDEYRRFEGGYFPLSEDGETVNIVLAELFLFWDPVDPHAPPIRRRPPF
jgi:hypothetical protein